MIISKLIKGFLKDLLRHPLPGTLVAYIYRNRIPSRGFVIDVNNSFLSPYVSALLFFRVYEHAEIRSVKRYLRRDLDVIELGASLGVVSCHICQLLGDQRKLICVEANPHLIRSLKLNLSINAPNTEVSIINRAVDYSIGKPKAFLALGANSLYSKVYTGASALEQDGACLIETATLSSILKDKDVDEYVLVADIEGSEAGIILYDREALEKCKQIIIELHRTTINAEEIGIEKMCEILQTQYQFTLRNQHNSVYVFEK